MCTYDSCVWSAKTYGSRKSWWDHEIERHRTKHVWVCAPCEVAHRESKFESPDLFDEHIDTAHTVKLNNSQLESVRDMCRKDGSVISPRLECPLCRISFVNHNEVRPKAFERTVRKHVSDHLEQLAFFVAIPAGRTLEEEDASEFADDSDSEIDMRSKIESIASNDSHLSKKQMQMENVRSFIADQGIVAHIAPINLSAAPIDITKSATHDWDASDESSSPQRPGPPTEPKFPLLILMHPPNEHFYARDDSLAGIRNTFSSPGSMLIMDGVGGVGKTLTAVEYLYVNKKHFDAIFWTQADTAPGLADSYVQMSLALGLAHGTEDLKHIIDKGRVWLQETGTYHMSCNMTLFNAIRSTMASRF